MANEIEYDYNTEELSRVILDLVNSYPGFDEPISFADISEDGGMTIFPLSGAVIKSKKCSITNHVTMMCMYPFCVMQKIYGISESIKIRIKEEMDKMGKWLERQPVVNRDGTVWLLESYPSVNGIKIKDIKRESPAFIDSVSDDKGEAWILNCNVDYEKEYDLP